MRFSSLPSFVLAAMPLTMVSGQSTKHVEIYHDEFYNGHKQTVLADRTCHPLVGPVKNHVGSIRIPSADVGCEVYSDATCTGYLTEVYSPGEEKFTQPYGHDAVAVLCAVDLLV